MADWQKIARFVAAREIKVAGNLLKGLCYLFHAICPEKRFTIPSRSKPLIRHKRERVIPRVVWQTNFTRRVTLPIYLNYLFNRMMAPTFEFRLLDDVEIRRWVLSLYPGRTFDSFSKLQIGAAQADLWRLLIFMHMAGSISTLMHTSSGRWNGPSLRGPTNCSLNTNLALQIISSRAAQTPIRYDLRSMQYFTTLNTQQAMTYPR